jgi:hypothetical protein
VRKDWSSEVPWFRERCEIGVADCDDPTVGSITIEADIEANMVGIGMSEDFDAIRAAELSLQVALKHRADHARLDHQQVLQGLAIGIASGMRALVRDHERQYQQAEKASR